MKMSILWLKTIYLELHCLSFSMLICINSLDQVIWLAKIRSGHGILIYSAWQHVVGTH